MTDTLNNKTSQIKDIPLLESQRGVYFECMNDGPESTRYNIAFALELPEKTDTDRFLKAVEAMAYHHPALFVTVGMGEDGPVMHYREPVAGEVKVTRSTAESPEEAKESFIRPFDFENGPLYRFELCETPKGTIFLWDIHHMIYDGTSVYVMLDQIIKAYGGEDIPEEEMSLADASALERSIKETRRYEEARDFFREQFKDTEFETSLIPDTDAGKALKGEGIVSVYTSDDLSLKKIEGFAREHGIRESSLLMAAFAYTESVFAGSKEAFFTTGDSGRYGLPLDNTLGMFVRTLPICIRIPENGTVADFLSGVQKVFSGTLKNDCISFSELSENYGVNTNVSYVYQGGLISEVTFEGSSLLPEELPLSDAQSDILMMAVRMENGYEIRTHYKKSLYSEDYVKSFAETVLSVVRGFLTCEKLDEIRLITDDVRDFIDEVNSTEKPFDEKETAGSVFERTVLRYPENTALVYKDRSCTYREFSRITGNLAAFITKKGIGTDDFVAVLSGRTDEAVIAAWGIIRSGAAFEMLDPTYPAERLDYMVKDSHAKLLIAERGLSSMLSGYQGDILYTDEISSLPETEGFHGLDEPGGAITMIYTSGTTGKPKGCVLENRNLTAFYHNHTDVMGIDEGSRVASYASFGFDAGAMDIVSTLMAGACLYIVPDEIRLDFMKVEEFYCKNGITHGFMTTQVGRTFAEETECSSLRALLVGGEKLVPFTPGKSFRFINGYGPCETFAYICHYDVTDNSTIQPIGKPSGNTKLYVADRAGRLMPVGAPGELLIAGAQVGRGYLGLPEKTGEVFVKNPYSEAKGYERVYRTGDVVRMLPGGDLEFIGRRDNQVKIRGFRVELTEIEEVVRRFPGVEDATVAAFDDAAGGKYIAAYVAGPDTIDTDALNSFIRAEKPAYMVPSVTMQIEAIPYTQNQKVNRRALPKPERKANQGRKPETRIQEKISDTVKKVLGHEDFDILTDLFDAGLTSIGTLKLNMLLGKEFDVPVKISDIRNHPTVEMLSEFFEAVKPSGSRGTGTSQSVPADYPLMANQMGVFIECSAEAGTTRYNMPLLLRISEEIDVERLSSAIKKAVNAHPYLKATLVTGEKGDVRTVRNDALEPVVSVISVPALPGNDELVRPFKLLSDTLYRAEIYVTEEGNYLFLDIHHIVADGTSFAVLINDINFAYGGTDPESEGFTGFDAALLEEKLRSSESYAGSEKYFETLLSGTDGDSLPGKCPEDTVKGSTGEGYDTFSCTFGACSEDIRAYCKKNGLSENAFFNAVFSYTLSEFLHSDDVTYCTIYSGRNDSRLLSCVAMLVKTLPVRSLIDIRSKVTDHVRATQAQLIDSMSNDVVPFSEISRKYGLKSELFFNYQGEGFKFDSIGGKKAENIPVALSDAKAPLSFEVFAENGVYRVEAAYSTDCYCSEFIGSFTGGLVTAAEGFTGAEVLSEVSVLSDDERKCFERMNETGRPFEKVPAHTLFERWALEHPSQVAVNTDESSITFGALNEKADRIAEALISRGAGNGEFIGLILERSELVPAAEIGILKAGCAFLPMLPSYPDDRLEFCLSDAGCRFVISTEDIIGGRQELFAEDKPYKALTLEELVSYDGTGGHVAEISQEDPAYCIYTSGSTGKPKGVVIEHHSLTNFVQTSALCETEGKGSAVMCMASISFDMSITEIFFSLSRGKTIYIASEEEIHNPDRLLSAFIKNKIDIMMMTPSFAWSLLSMPGAEGALSQLKSVVLGAEAFQPVLLSRLKALNPDMLVQNGYGPTECTQVCSVKTLTEGGSITIGGPFANIRFHVMDTGGNLLPRYAVGELIISGEGVCRGYVNLPEKNAAAFTEIEGLRAYHSGDLVRINREGEAEFGGRADNQVKLRGFRVELDEVENVMQEFPGIKQVKVIVRNNGTEDFLAGFFTGSATIDVDELTAFMKTKLTYYMVPAAMMQLEEMPMTQNGKLDKKALPEIRPQRKAKAKRAPKKSLEEKILDIFKEVLSVEDCYVDDNFFEVGGTSLSASKVVMQLKAAGYKIEYQDIFDHQSAEELAEYLEPAGLAPKEGREASAEAGNPGTLSEMGVILTEAEPGMKDVLKHNAMEYADRVVRESLGDVLLTGATGFLGIHVLRELLRSETGHVTCLVRKGRYRDSVSRLKSTLVYYFEDDFRKEFEGRISVIEGDITDENLKELFTGLSFDTLINCAASVKHYAKDDSIEFVNVRGVENLIALAREKDARMIQISTTSVPGAHNQETYRVHLRMTEDRLFVVDDMNNQYIQSKHRAEVLMLNAVRGGLRGKIIRVGNLMGRYSDGEFQTNMRQNAFLNGLRGFVNIGKCPISHSTDPMNFSPVDCTAKAVVLLAGTNDCFTVFNADSRQTFDEMKVIDTINRCGITVRPVKDEEYYADFYRMMGDSEKNEKVSALLTNDRPDVHMVETDNRFTANVLYRLGFSWPFISDTYLEKVIESLATLAFFDD